MISNSAVLSNPTRTAISNSNSTDREIFDFGDYNKLSSSTKLVIWVLLPAIDFNGHNIRSIGLKYGSASTYWGGGYYYTQEASGFGFISSYLSAASHSTTGNQAVSLRDGSASLNNGRPFGVLNPNGSTDDLRLHQTVSTAIIYEIV